MSIIALAIGMLGYIYHPAWSHEITTTGYQCASTPCGNTATGEDPQEVLLREARAEQNKIKSRGPDQVRWQIPIYSTSTKKSDLEMLITKSAEFSMRLAPAKAYLYFSLPSSNQAFKIGEPNATDSLCPKYNLQIVDASDKHAVVQKNCPRTQYRAGKFFSGVTYYLYDAPTATMREIWRASAVGSKDPLPLAEPVPSVKIIDNGYLFDWKGLHPGGSSTSSATIHNKYVRKTEHNKQILVCVDMKVQGGAVEDEICEGTTVPKAD